MEDDKKITRVLFLLRSYNDIDHIVPIIWKCRQCKLDCYYLLVESDHSRDYRIEFIKKSGAIRIHSQVMNYYHSYVRHFLISDNVKNIFDRLAGYMIGRPLLRKNKIEVVVTEWSGRSGREPRDHLARREPGREVRISGHPGRSRREGCQVSQRPDRNGGRARRFADGSLSRG